MTETAPEATPEQVEGAEGTVETDETAEPETFNADYVRKLRAEAAKYRKQARELEPLAREAAVLKEAQLKASQTLEERAAQADSERDTALTQSLRFKVALDKGLPPNLVARLHGATEDELSADADDLLTWVKQAGSLTRPTIDQGVRGQPAAPTAADQFGQILKSAIQKNPMG